METLLKKLQIKDGFAGKIINTPDELQKGFEKWPESLLSKNSKDLDYLLIFCKNSADLNRHADKISQVRKDALLWFAYPKKSSGMKTDLSRDQGWEVLDRMGLRPVRMISLDDTWSVFRFREKSLVKKRS